MKHVVSFSGGKDSTAMLLMMVEQNIPIDEVICYSMGSWEWDEMLLHIEKIKNDIPSSIEFTELGDEEKLQYGFDKWGFPNFMIRWCTGMKTDALKKYLNRNYMKGEYIQYFGIAFDEAERSKKKWVKPHYRFPLVEWGITEEQALEYCYSKGYDWGGIYEELDGKRMSCWCCPLQQIGDLKNLYFNHPVLWKRLEELQQNNKIRDFFKQGVSVFDLEKRFKSKQLCLKGW